MGTFSNLYSVLPSAPHCSAICIVVNARSGQSVTVSCSTQFNQYTTLGHGTDLIFGTNSNAYRLAFCLKSRDMEKII